MTVNRIHDKYLFGDRHGTIDFTVRAIAIGRAASEWDYPSAPTADPRRSDPTPAGRVLRWRRGRQGAPGRTTSQAAPGCRSHPHHARPESGTPATRSDESSSVRRGAAIA